MTYFILLTVVLLLAFTVLNGEYLFGWVAHNWQFYAILVGIVLVLIYFISALMTAGIGVGLFVANYFGKLIVNLNNEKITEAMKAEEIYKKV